MASCMFATLTGLAAATVTPRGAVVPGRPAPAAATAGAPVPGRPAPAARSFRSVERPRITVSLSSGERIEVAWPFNWSLVPIDQVKRDAGVEVVVVFEPNYNENAQVRLNLWREPAPELKDPDRLRARHTEEATPWVAHSVEQHVAASELKVAGGRGLLSTFTDARRVGQPVARGEFKTTTIATIALAAGVLVTAEVLCDSPKRAEFSIGRAILESLRVLEPEAKAARRGAP